MTSIDRRSILLHVLDAGFQITPDALDYILSSTTPLQILTDLLATCELDAQSTMISLDTITSFLTQADTEIVESDESDLPLLSEKESERTHLDNQSIVEPDTVDSSVQILRNPEYDLVGSTGTVEDFLSLFHDRFKRIRDIYMKRIDTSTAVSPKTASMHRYNARARRALIREGKKPERRPVTKVIGIVSEKSISRSRNVIITLEDAEGSIVCVIPAGRKGLKGAQLVERGSSLLLDEIVCLAGYVDEEGRLIANDVIYPDVPTSRPIGRAKRDVYTAFISDLHCGSEEYLEDEFDNFIDWLRGSDVDGEDKTLSAKTEYLIIAGDLVDGIGVYPTQHEKLLIPDLYEQYDFLARKLRRLPDRIKIIAVPGNHDACRQALPRPPFAEEFIEPLMKLDGRITLLGDPSFIKVEGVKIAITHGDSMDDLVVNTPGASYTQPAIGMRQLLIKRHLAPIYGGKTELAPLHRDWLVIDDPPDIVHFGHAHHNAVDNYRGIQIINSGTFQGQTDFMRKQGIVPTPGIVTFINLRDGTPEMRFFYDVDKFAQ